MDDRPEIRIDGLTLYTHHGVADAEQEVGQRLVLDLELRLGSLAADRSDDVADTVDYGSVTGLAADLATARSYRTLERLAAVIAEAVLERFDRVERVLVRATKPVPPLPWTMAGTSVAIVRCRDGQAR